MKLFDDGQDLQLGTSYIRGLSWDINAKVNIDKIQFIDKISPIGTTLESGLWANPGDVVSAKVNLQFNDSNINLDSLSPYDEIGCKVNNDSQLIDLLQFENGQMTCEFTVPSNTQEESFLVELWVQSCLLYTSPSPRDGLLSRMPSSA